MCKWIYDIIGLVLIIIVEVLFWVFSEPLSGMPYFQPTVDSAITIAKRALMGPGCNGSILLFGDSSCMFGFNTKIISDRLGIPCVNFGTLSSFTIAGAESQIREVTMKYKPKAIVLSFIPRSFEVDVKHASEFRLLGRYLIAYNLKSNVYQPDFEDFKSLIFKKHQFNIFPAEFCGSFNALLTVLEKNQGYFPEYHKKYENNEGIKNEFHPSVFVKKAFFAIDEIANKENIPLFICISPSPSDAVDSNYILDADSFIKSVSASCKKLRVLRTAPVWEPRFFATVTHVNETGASINSEELVELIKDQMSSY